MIITITSWRLKRWCGFFKLSLWGLKILRQTKTRKGFTEMKNTGFVYLHYTLSAWETEADAKNFPHSAAHLKAMKDGQNLAAEIRIYIFRHDQIPEWNEVKKLVRENGRIISFEN